MGWAEIIKAVNSNISVPLDKLITSAKDSLNVAITNAKNGVDTSITNAKNELSTLIKKNGTSYPNVMIGKLMPGENLEITGKGKITAKARMDYSKAKVIIDGGECPSLLFSSFNEPQLLTFTFENNISFQNTNDPKTASSSYYVEYIVQLSD